MIQDPDYTLDAGLPANVDAERTILGAILLDNEAFFDDSMELTPDDFSLDSHRRIYLVINDILFGMVEGLTQVDIRTLSTELANRKWIESIGGVAYVASLTEGLPRRPKIDNYVHILKEKATLRRLMGVCSATIAKAQDQSERSGVVIQELQTNLFEIAGDGMNTAVPIGSVTPAVESKIRSGRTISNERTALELTWGLKGMDEFTHGLFKGEFTVIGGESGGGKSSYLLQMLLANAAEGTPCGLFSLEMSKEQMTQRCYPLLSEILTSNHVRDPRLMNLHTHIPEMEKVSRYLSSIPLHIDDTKQLRIDKMIAKMRALRRKLGIRIFGVDYLQLIKLMPKKNRLEGFEEMLFMLRDFPTKEPDCALVVLSQYSQADKFVKSKRRSKDSLYGGSVIHHAAQNVVMITIEDPEKRDENDLLDAEFRFAKQREGKTGKVKCVYDRDHYKFTYMTPVLKGG